ncbi:hypothetical protein [Arenibacterium sp. LLYu02]|uniref:hypothetical protein n=1 Tax=Arenibacterium sp. LLYu02 TaxID=3404132 RepID=UPI003B21EBD7
MTWGSFGWGAKSYSFGGKASCGGNYSSWSNHGWTYDAWSGGSNCKSWFDKDDDDKHGKHGWDKPWGKGRDDDDDDQDRDDKDCDDDKDGGKDGHSWGHHGGFKWGGRGDDHHGGSCGRDDDEDDDDQDDTGSEPPTTVTFTVGENDEFKVEIEETEEGKLILQVSPADWGQAAPDIDGLFMNLTDDSTADGLHIHPNEDNFPVTGQEINPNAVNEVDDGVTLSENFDIGLQFGEVPDSTEGTIHTAYITMWSDNGPLSIKDLDLSKLVVVTGLDNDDPQVLVGGYDDPTTPEDETDTGLDDIMALMNQDPADDADALIDDGQDDLDLAV